MKHLRLLSLLCLSIVVSWGAYAQETQMPNWKAMHYLSQEEMEAGMNNRLTNFTATAAPTGTIRFPGEFEPMQAVIVRYPLGVPASFIKTLAEECKVITLVASSSQSSAQSAFNNAGVNMNNVEFVNVSTDSYWVRDYGPWLIFNNKQPAIVDNRYNRPRENDDIVPVRLAENYFNIPWYGMDVTHTGGNMMEDGRGFGISDILVINESTSTESGYSGITEAQVYERMEAYLGIDNYLVTDDPQGQYIAHVDCWGKLLAPDKVLIARMPTTDDRYQNYEDIANYFATTNCCWGYPYQVFRVDELSSSTSESTSYLAPYTNSLILNNRVFVPLGTNTTYNNNALQVYRDAMPGYTIIGVANNSSYRWYNTDALHCRTRGVMDFEMLFVDHRNVIHGEQPMQDAYQITSTFIAYSGQDLLEDQLLIYYRINEGEWQTAPMTATREEDEYTGFITGCPYGATVEYYVSASDASGHTATQPVMGPSDPHKFTIEAAPITYTITATASPAGYGTVTGAGTYEDGENVILVATPVGNNIFVNWTENGDVVSTNATYSFTAAMDRNLVANFESTLYWTPVSDEYNNNMPMTAVIQIDGVEQFTDALEVGVFCGDECRGSAIGELFPYNNRYLLSLIFFGDTGESYSFRLYDHSTGTELTDGTLNAPANVTFNEDGYGTPTDPYVLNFTSVTLEYTVTLTANPTEGGTVSGDGTFEAGTEITVSATASDNYTFFNWTLNGNTVSTNPEYTFAVNANTELVANFNLKTYNIAVNINPAEGGTVTGAGTYSHGETVNLSATANENYRFIGWMENGEVISSETSYSFTAESNRTLTAKFSSLLYWTAEPGENEDNMTMSAYILIDDVEQFTNTLEVGVFVGEQCRASAIGVKPPFSDHYILSLLVYGSADESFSFRLYDHTQETELTPELVAPADVTFNTNGYGSPKNPYPLNFTSVTPEYEISVEADPTEGGTVSITGESPYLQNTEVTVTATANTGYEFINWTVNNEQVSDAAEYTFNADADKTLVAHFELIEYNVTITADANAGTAAITEDGPYHYNDVINLTHSENAGYEFVNFTVDGDEISTPYTVTGDVEIVANFNLLSYEVTVSADPTAGGTVSGADTYNYGTSATVTATAANGYTFVNWTKEGTQVSTDASYSFTVTEATALVAHFSLNSYIITAQANPTEGGTVSGSGGYDYGQSCTLTATANDGYTFVNWTKEGTEVSTDAEYTINVTETATYVANFSHNEYNVTVTADAEAGTATITEAAPYYYGTEINVTATANTGYEFVNFTVNGQEVTMPYTVTGDVEIVANFNHIEYNVTVTADAEAGSASITEAGPYYYGSEINVTATANTGYEFVNFTVDGTEVTMPYTVTGDVEIIANFELSIVEHPFSLNAGWNWWSTYIEMNNVQGLQLLENALGDNGVQIKYQNQYTSHSSSGWHGSLQSINNERMYQINMAVAGNHTITGTLANPEEHPINLNAGWNWVGYVENITMSVDEALANLTLGDEDILKSHTLFTTYYEDFGWFGDLETLEPGQGYMVKATNATSFTYPANAKGTVNSTNVNKFWNPNASLFPNNMNVLAVIELNGVELRSEEVELGVFANDGECRGSAMLRYVEPIDRYVAFLTVYGEDGDVLSLRMRVEGMTYNVNEQLTMMANEVIGSGRNPVTMTAKGTGLDEISTNINLYPNPVGQGQEVRIELPETINDVTVEVIDVLGRIVLTYKDATHCVSTPNEPGVYTVRVTDEQGQTWFGKLIVK